MDSERRALNDQERAELSATTLWEADWIELVGFSALGGGFLGGLVLLVVSFALRSIGVDVNDHLGLSGIGLALLGVVIGASSFVGYVVWFEIRGRNDAALKHQQILQRDDLIFEVHKIVESKLVREPEHGQCMYFVKTLEGKVIFVFEGQEDLQENWEKSPLVLPENERPRRELKIVRLPETKEGILVQFDGPEVLVREWFEMTLAPHFWPASGKVITSPWDDLQGRYKLKSMNTPVSWKTVAQFFEEDGSLRDIIVSETVVADWEKLLSLSKRIGRVSYKCDGKEAGLPSSVRELLNDTEHSHCMEVDLGGSIAKTHFFSSDEIELDLDPCDIDCQEALDNILGFCAELSKEIQRDVKITYENSPEDVFLCYSYKGKSWRT